MESELATRQHCACKEELLWVIDALWFLALCSLESKFLHPQMPKKLPDFQTHTKRHWKAILFKQTA